MAVERRQLRRYQENDKRRCLAAKAISQPDAADGWRAAHARSAIGGRSICVEHKPASFTQSQLNCIRSKRNQKSADAFGGSRPIRITPNDQFDSEQNSTRLQGRSRSAAPLVSTRRTRPHGNAIRLRGWVVRSLYRSHRLGCSTL